MDEDELYTLSNLAQKKSNMKTIKSDHRTLILDLNLHFSKIKPDTQEFFNFKSEICQEKFKNITDNEYQLIECLQNNLPIDAEAKIWQKTLESAFHKLFKKVKVKNSKKKSDSKETKLIEERQALIRKAARNPNDELTTRISDIEDQLCKSNYQSSTSHMTRQLSLAAENDSTSGTRSAWSIYRKL